MKRQCLVCTLAVIVWLSGGPCLWAESTGFAARLEQVAQRMLPQKTLDKALGFFAPVTKKYLPVFNQFQSEYAGAVDKRAVVAKYTPQAEQALAAAKAMSVPAKYEPEKQKYIRMAEAFVVVLKMNAMAL